MDTPNYEEVHRIVSEDWTRILVGFGVFCWGVFLAVVCAFTEGGSRLPGQPMFWFGSLGGLFGVTIPALWKMVVRVDAAAVSMRMYPLWTSHVPHEEIAGVSVRELRLLREYGGGGIRWTPWAGWWWIGTWSRKGVQLDLHGGKRILIASRTPEKLEAAIRAHRPSERAGDHQDER